MSNFCRNCRTPLGSDTVCPTCDSAGSRACAQPLPVSQQERPPESESGHVSQQRCLALSKRAKLLAVRTAKVCDRPVVLLAVRIGTLSLNATNLTLTAPQARRLLTDLTELFNDPELLDAAGPLDHEARIAFNRLMGVAISTEDPKEAK